MTLIYHAGNEAALIPSLTELSATLRVARSTVQIAIKQLIQEEFLVTKVGIGTFTNPQLALHGFHARRKAVGLIIADGKGVYLDWYAAMLQAALVNALGRRCLFTHFINLDTYDEDGHFEEIRLKGLDGLLWLVPRPSRHRLIRRLAETLPLVVVDKPVPGVNGFQFNARENGAAIGRRLREEGCRAPAVSPDVALNTEKHDGIVSAFAVDGAEGAKAGCWGARDFDVLEARMARGWRPDAFVFNPQETSAVLELLGRHGVAREACLLLSCFFRQEGFNERMLVHPVSIGAYSDWAVNRLGELMRGEDPEVRHECVKNALDFHWAEKREDPDHDRTPRRLHDGGIALPPIDACALCGDVSGAYPRPGLGGPQRLP